MAIQRNVRDAMHHSPVRLTGNDSTGEMHEFCCNRCTARR
ncbi:hypothetical protein C7S14_3401 [Burkholderia cepacia]|nr:hypothetical protein C7S14_3401 [Burkholderia cepacia]